MSDASHPTIANVIDGASSRPLRARRSRSSRPATGALLSLVARSRAADVDAAVDARPSPRSRAGRAQTPVARGAVLRRIAQLLERDAEALAQIVAAETGKPPRDARGETGGAIEHGLLHRRRGPAPVRPDDDLGGAASAAAASCASRSASPA